jgi:hypothetical protein
MRRYTRNVGLRVAAVLLTASGCTSILGDFTEGSSPTDAGSPPADGSMMDGPVTSEGGSPDGSVDGGLDGESSVADAALPKLTCTMKYATPIVIDDLSHDDVGTSYLNGAFFTMSMSPTQLRIITQRGNNELFTMYTYDRTAQTTAVLDGPPPPMNGSGGIYNSSGAIHHFSLGPLQGVTLAAANVYDPTNGPGYEIFPIDDGQETTGNPPSPIVFYETTAQNFNNGNNGSFFPFDENDIFGTISYEGPASPPEYYMGAGRATFSSQATLDTVGSSVFENAFQGVEIVHAGSSLYLFSENANQDLGESAWVIPDTASITTPPTPRAFSTGSICTVFDVTPSVAQPASTNFVYAEGVAGQDSFTSLSLYVGAIPNANLATVVSTDLTLAKTFTNVAEAPFGESNPQWQGDDLVMIGGGIPGPDGGFFPGQNFLWFNVEGTVRAEQIGPNAILQDRTNIQESSGALVAATATTAQIDVVWTEDVNNSHNVIYYNQLECTVGD